MNRIPLNVLGISYSQTQTGAYALVLSEEGGERRIPIIVGGFEAQAIAIQLEGLKPPRPLTHDLFHKFASTFKIVITEVEIYKLEEGVFYSKIICNNGVDNYILDARTSDAIALALRFGCPIYTTADIMDRAGIYIDLNEVSEEETEDLSDESSQVREDSVQDQSDLAEFDIKALNEMLQKAVESEDYEKASMIKREIEQRNNK